MTENMYLVDHAEELKALRDWRESLPKVIQELVMAERLLAYAIGRCELQHSQGYDSWSRVKPYYDVVQAEYTKIIEATGVFNAIRAEHKVEKDDMWDKMTIQEVDAYTNKVFGRLRRQPRYHAEIYIDNLTPGELQSEFEEFFGEEYVNSVAGSVE